MIDSIEKREGSSHDLAVRLCKLGQSVEESIGRLTSREVVDGSTDFAFLRGEERTGTVTVSFHRGYYERQRDAATFTILIEKTDHSQLTLRISETTDEPSAKLNNKPISISDPRGCQLMAGIIRDLEHSWKVAEKNQATSLHEHQRAVHEAAMDELAKF